MYSILFIIHIIMIYESDNTGHYKENVKYGSGGAEFKYASSAGGGGGVIFIYFIYLVYRQTYCKKMPSREN